MHGRTSRGGGHRLTISANMTPFQLALPPAPLSLRPYGREGRDEPAASVAGRSGLSFITFFAVRGRPAEPS